jgi:hypothetical protein
MQYIQLSHQFYSPSWYQPPRFLCRCPSSATRPLWLRTLRARPAAPLTASTSASPPPMTTASTRLCHHHGASWAPAAPSTGQPDHNYVGLGHLPHGFFNYGHYTLTLSYLDIGTKGYALHEDSSASCPATVYVAHRLLWLLGDVSLSASSLVSPFAALPLWLRGNVRVNRNSTTLSTHMGC